MKKEVKQVLTTIGIQALRLIFQTTVATSLYLIFRYQIYNSTYSGDTFSQILIVAAQLVYWFFSFSIEVVTYNIYIEHWKKDALNSKKVYLKLSFLVYILGALGVCYLFVSQFLNGVEFERFNLVTEDTSHLKSKIIYGIELILSIVLCVNFFLVYKSQFRTSKRSKSANRPSFGKQYQDSEKIDNDSSINDFERVTLSQSFLCEPDLKINNDTCKICSFEIDETSKIIILSCKHAFHSHCIRENDNGRRCHICSTEF